MRLSAVFVVVLGLMTLATPPVSAGDQTSLFAKDNLVAWCIVPFDAGERGPAARAKMLKRLGITKLAYDWRAKHVPSFEDEILSMKKEGIEFFAFWSPASNSPGYQSMMKLLEKYKLHPQIWMIAPSIAADSREKRVELSAKPMLPFVEQAKQLGCKFALYNHGGWSGQPANMIAMVQWLRKRANTRNIGIVYNFHHGHEHLTARHETADEAGQPRAGLRASVDSRDVLSQFSTTFREMVPYLLCVNLNGMSTKGPMILPLGQGEHDRKILEMIRDSGYQGPIGILDHRGQLDAEESLKENLDGLKKLLEQMGDREALETWKR